MDQYEQVDWGALVTVLLKCMDEQKIMLKELSAKLDRLSETSKKDENINYENTDLLNIELTNRVGDIENDIDTLKEVRDYVYSKQSEIDCIKEVDYVTRELSDRLDVQEANNNDMRLKYQDVKVKHDRLERHAVDHWGYRF